MDVPSSNPEKSIFEEHVKSALVSEIRKQQPYITEIPDLHQFLVTKANRYLRTNPQLTNELHRVAKFVRPYDPITGYDQEKQVDKAFMRGELLALAVLDDKYDDKIAILGYVMNRVMEDWENIGRDHLRELGIAIREKGDRGTIIVADAMDILEDIAEQLCDGYEEFEFLRSGFGYIVGILRDLLVVDEQRSHEELAALIVAYDEYDWDAALKGLEG